MISRTTIIPGNTLERHQSGLACIYRVVKRINEAVYVIQKTPKANRIVVNVDKLRKYEGKTPDYWGGCWSERMEAADH